MPLPQQPPGFGKDQRLCGAVSLKAVIHCPPPQALERHNPAWIRRLSSPTRPSHQALPEKPTASRRVAHHRGAATKFKGLIKLGLPTDLTPRALTEYMGST